MPDDALAALTARARDDLARVAHPATPWLEPHIGPDGKPALDVLVAGGGQSGLATAIALLRAQVTNIQVVDRAPRGLEGPLDAAEQHGAVALREFLAAHGNAIKDPRRAWIELDYVVLAGASDPGEARRVYSKVKARLTPDSPVYSRLKQLEKTYE